MSFQNASALAAEVKALVSLPDIYFQLNDMIRDSRRSMADIGAVVAKDAGLSARLLRLVNSSFYGFQSKIDTISRAIAVVGVDDLYNLVVATCVVDRFAKIPEDLEDMTAFWMRSVHCGIITKRLGKHCAALNIERLFLSGLLRDIGLLALYQMMPLEMSRVLMAIDGDRRLLLGFEQEIIGFTQADVARELLKAWQLPESLYDVVGGYFEPESVIKHKLDAHLLKLAGRLVDDREYGRSIAQTLQDMPEQTLSLIRLSTDQIEQVMQEAEAEFLEVFEHLRPV